MFKNFRKLYPLYVLVDLSFFTISFYLPYFLKHNTIKNIFSQSLYLPNLVEYSFVFILWATFLTLFFKRRNLYTTDRSITIPKEIWRVAISIIYSGILIAAIVFFSQYKFFSRSIFFYSCGLLFLLAGGFRIFKRILLRKLIAEGFHNINVLVVGQGDIANAVAEEIKRNPWWGFRIVGFLSYETLKVNNSQGNGSFPFLGKCKDFSAVVRKNFIDEVIVAEYPDKNELNYMIDQAKEMRVGIRVVPEDFEKTPPILDISYLGIVPLLTYKEHMHHPADFALKRIFDFINALFLLIIFFPLLALIAIVIKITSQGPIFYVQKRVGIKGQLFNFYKFRSMVKDADKLKPQLLDKNEVKDGVIFKIKRDPRITNFGRFLRRHSLDELPQLFNVLKGDMSLVGPRPPTKDEVDQYSHYHMQRLSIRPGITGLSQVKGRSNLSFYHWVKWDVWYINNWSFLLDMRIILWTIPAVLRGKGAY